VHSEQVAADRAGSLGLPRLCPETWERQAGQAVVTLPRLDWDAAVAQVEHVPDLRERVEVYANSAWSTFQPRPDRPELFDQQSGFCHTRDMVSFLIGGNAKPTRPSTGRLAFLRGSSGDFPCPSLYCLQRPQGVRTGVHVWKGVQVAPAGSDAAEAILGPIRRCL
jgi:hypothetical protein